MRRSPALRRERETASAHATPLVKRKPLHPWNLTPTEAIALQKRLACRVDACSVLGRCELIAGVDASYSRFSPILYAAVVVVSTRDWSVVEAQHVVARTSFPYIPGLLTFREAPPLLDAFAKLRHRPDAVMVDGQGFAHPRRLGIASHLGLWLGIPTLGCAKSRLIGAHKEPGRRAGSQTPLLHEDEIIGSVVRSKHGVKPLYVSVGHKIDLPSAVSVVLESCRGYRLPEPTRQAHLHVNEVRRRAATS
jgi:deoxyribonuclease V